jgi:hypothetical protein
VSLANSVKNTKFSAISSSQDYTQWKQEELVRLQRTIPGALSHQTSPLVYHGCGEAKTFIGGYTEFNEWVDMKDLK